jgi:multidrug resistance efflux pump
MSRKRAVVIAGLVIVASGIGFYAVHARPDAIVLTGIVTTNDVIVSPQISGRLGQVLVQEGDAVKPGQLLAVLAPDELRAESAYYEHTAEGATSQVEESAAELRFQEQQTADQIRQAEANVAAASAQEAEARADLANAQANLRRIQELARDKIVPAQQLDQARAIYEAAKARVDALRRQVEAQRAAVALARSNAQQIAVRRSQLQGNEHQRAAADAQREKAGVRLAYTEIRAPIAGLVDVRAARPGEVVTPGQPIVTLVNPDDLWVRADVEESYIDRVRIGDRLTVRLPSGVERPGTVFFRGVDAAFATQRDVSRTKRDIKTFEIRLRVDNKDRRLAVGMTAYVLLPLSQR